MPSSADIPAMYLPYTWPGGQRRRPAPQRADVGTLARLRYTPGTSPASRREETSAGVRKLEPCHRPPPAPPPAPPRRKAGNELEPPAAFRVAASGSQLRHPWPAPIGDLDPDNAVPVLTATVTVSPGAPEPLCRTLLEKTSLTSKAATSPHGCPGPSTPATNARATRARSARPASVTLSRTARPAITAPAFPAARAPGNRPGGGRTQRKCTLDSAANVKPAHGPREPSVARPWSRPPSVAVRESRVPTPLPGPDSRPLCVRGHRNTTPYSATR